MSIDSDRICCTGCGLETREVYCPIRIIYRLDGCKEIETGCSSGWCYECEDYKYIEDMDPESLRGILVEKEQGRHEARFRADKLSKVFLANIRNRVERRRLHDSIGRFDEEIRDLSDLLDIATNRKAGARCLSCWSDKTAPVTFDSDNLSHNFLHSCGGMLKIIHTDILSNDVDVVRFNFDLITFVLSEEGELLGKR